jgi:dihydroorotase
MLLYNCRTILADSLVDCAILADGESGKISGISRVADENRPVDERLDCRGLVALPGMVDVHVHFRDPGQIHKEDFYSGTAGALAGGTTAILDMPNNSPPICNEQSLKEKIAVARGKAVCDWGLYFGATPANQEEAARIARGHSEVKGLKVYLGSSTGDLLVEDAGAVERHLQSFPKGKIVAMHAEDEREIRGSTAELKQKDPEGSVEYHNIIRSPKAASLAVQAACDLGSKAHRHVHICHASTKGEIDVVRTYRNGAEKVSVEVCPHHLFLTENDALRLGNYGKVNPPLRSRVDVAALWDELSMENSVVDCIATDHAPHTREEKEKGYWDAPSGIPGVQTRVPLMLDAVNRNLISLSQMVKYCATNPAKLFGLEGKGSLREGMDADIILVDLKKEWTIRAEGQLSKCGHTPYDGRKVTGSVEKTFLRGKLAWDGENVCAKAGDGKPL